MTNTNCLENIKCPACGNEESFRIAAKTIATVTDDGVDDYGDMEWDDDSYAECGECCRHGTLKDFTVGNGPEADEHIAVTNTGHTPGNWKIAGNRDSDTQELRIVEDSTGGEIAVIYPTLGYAQADIANARLIVAAPAQAVILSLVQQGLMTLQDGEAEFDGVMYVFDAHQPDWCVGVVDAIGWDAARAAIAEATQY
jgi:hypothetical protein